jgi:DNA polymerase Ligase (LigD)
MSYIKEKLKPGYTGKYVIQKHLASHEHFDLRLEFPVDSVAKALADYSGKRPTKGVEPTAKTPDKPGSVLRSWAIPKHRFPGHKPILATETENHIMAYASFKGTIPEGQYGAGTVTIVSHGTYTLDDVEYDKKYVFTLHSKHGGTYALIKTGGGKNFLWIKTKEQKKACISDEIRKVASAIDYVRPTMNKQLWDLKQDPPKLLPNIRKTIINTLLEHFTKKGLMRPFQWIKGLYISGSSTGYNYTETGDVDIDITYDKELVLEAYPELKKLTSQELYDYLRKVMTAVNKTDIPGTSLTFSYLVLAPGDNPVADGIYNILEDKWLKLPKKIPVDFDPDHAFIKYRLMAEQVSQRIDLVVGAIIRSLNDLRKIDQFDQYYGGMDEKRKPVIENIKKLCTELNTWYDWIWSLQDRAKNGANPVYPVFDYSPNWEERMIIFKYLVRSGYHQCVSMLYSKLEKGDSYRVFIDQFIPN